VESEMLRSLIKINSLPALSESLKSIVDTACLEEQSFKDLGKIISKDLSLASRVVRLANSSYFGLSHQVDTISSAILVLGAKTVFRLALASCAFPTIDKNDVKGTTQKREFWQHSFLCARAAETIAKKCNLSNKERYFTAGLLHDVGIAVLDSQFSDDYARVLSKVREEKISLVDAERSVLGTDHAQVGGFLAKRWHFPENLRIPIEYHHNVKNAPTKHVISCCVVSLADFISANVQTGIINVADEPEPDIYRLLNIKPASIENMIEKFKSVTDEVEEFINAAENPEKVVIK